MLKFQPCIVTEIVLKQQAGVRSEGHVVDIPVHLETRQCLCRV